MNGNYLLKTEGARTIYESVASLPIIDFHNHIAVGEIAADRHYESITALWLAPDPYKHRLMRICGIPERYITGDASDYEKFERFCAVFPQLCGNPVYDWARMELARVFDIHVIPSAQNARRIYDETAERLASPEYGAKGLLSLFGVEYQSPVCALLDDLTPFDGVRVAPSLRADDLLSPSADLRVRLKAKTGKEDYLAGVGVMLDRLTAKGCRFADHALDAGFFADVEKVDMLQRLGVEYAKRGMTLLLHMDAKRDTSDRLRALAGPAGGYAAVGGSLDTCALISLLGSMEREGGLPETVLFPLNMSDVPALAVLQGSFSEDGVPSKVGLGPAWWWCDHALGIKNTLSCVASFGVLSEFIGMTTDSRSILSFVRHDYFRRILASFLDEESQRGEWGLPSSVLCDIAAKICYYNAKRKIRGN